MAVHSCQAEHSRLTAHGSRLTAHGSRLTAHGSRLTAQMGCMLSACQIHEKRPLGMRADFRGLHLGRAQAELHQECLGLHLAACMDAWGVPVGCMYSAWEMLESGSIIVYLGNMW